MNIQRIPLLVAVLLAAFLAACGAKTTTETKEAAQAPVPQRNTRTIAPPKEDPHWSYEVADGPSMWGKLSAKWKECAAGRSQSPIDIAKTSNAKLPALKAEFRPAELKIIHHEHMADVVNTGHSIQVNYTEGDKLKLGNEEFELLQYHFHSPSEHTVRGKHYPMEMHMVHRSADKKLAVVGVFIEEGATNPAFDSVWSNLPEARGVEHHLPNVKVDVNQLLPQKTNTYRYSGSLTTPPCSEDVQWVIMTTPIQMSASQIEKFRNILKGNNRPPQPLYSRAVVTERASESVIQ